MFNELTGSQLGMVGGILGCVLGFAGGLFGTCCCIRNTQGPRERKFMIQASVAVWVAVMLFVTLLMVLPSPYRFLTWVPYGILLLLGIRYINKRQKQIMRAENGGSWRQARSHPIPSSLRH
jgi:drug/metabolite transporter (DMT)-like permease